MTALAPIIVSDRDLEEAEALMASLLQALDPATGDTELRAKLGLTAPPYEEVTTQHSQHYEDPEDDYRPSWAISAHNRPRPPRQRSQLRRKWPISAFARLELREATELVSMAESLSRNLAGIYWANPRWCLRTTAATLWGPENWRTSYVWSMVPRPQTRTTRPLEARLRAFTAGRSR